MDLVVLMLPTVETEMQREENADGKWRIYNGLGYVGNYDTEAEARRNGIIAGATKIAKANNYGAYTEYDPIKKIGGNIDLSK